MKQMVSVFLYIQKKVHSLFFKCLVWQLNYDINYFPGQERIRKAICYIIVVQVFPLQ